MLDKLINYEKRKDIRKNNFYKRFKAYFPPKELRKSDECWNWQGTMRKGYGRITNQGKRVDAHRLSYEFYKGKIPKGLIVRHKCDNPRCVNPKHLLVGTYGNNISDMFKRNRANIGKKLNTEAIKVIRWMLKYRSESGLYAKLSKLYHVNHTTLRKIERNKTWVHVKVI